MAQRPKEIKQLVLSFLFRFKNLFLHFIIHKIGELGSFQDEPNYAIQFSYRFRSSFPTLGFTF